MKTQQSNKLPFMLWFPVYPTVLFAKIWDVGTYGVITLQETGTADTMMRGTETEGDRIKELTYFV